MNGDQSDCAGVASNNEADRRSLFMLIVAAIIGIGLGSLTAADWLGNDRLSGTVVARINDTDIPLHEYQRALAMFASEKRDPLNDHDRTLVLERMVEEELLVQHGVDSGLVRGDRGVRTVAIESILSGLIVDIEADATDATRDTRLREYLGQLHDVASIRWMDGAPGR